MFTDFAQIVEHRHEHLASLKAQQDKKVIGYLCSYVPEEIIYAAGAIPVRLFSSEEPPTQSDALMQSYYCTFARSILHQGLAGRFDYLDGVVWAYSCITMSLAFESWQRIAPLPFMSMLHIPCLIDTDEGRNFYITELRRFRRDMESFVGHSISDDDLWQSIQTYDTNRALVMQLFEQRKADIPTLTGLEAFQVTLSSMLTDKENHNALMLKLLQELPNRPSLPPPLGRLMLVGSPVDNLQLLSIIEEDGSVVVTDDTCTGTRYLYGTTPVPSSGDPLEALADRYLLSRPPCPTKYSQVRWEECASCPYRAVGCFKLAPAPRSSPLEQPPFPLPQRDCRFRHILQLAVKHKVEGVVCVLQKFCDPHGYDYHHVIQLFEAVGVPTVEMEVENVISAGQLRTRVQAFIEMLQPVEYLVEPGILRGE